MSEDDSIETEPFATANDVRGFRDRRTVLKAIGVGAMLPLAVGPAGAKGTEDAQADEDEHDDEENENDEDEHEDDDHMEFDRCEPCIDPLTGWATLSADDTGGFDVDHVVDLRVEPLNVLFEAAEVPAEEADGEEPGEEEAESEAFPDFFFDPVGLAVEPGDVVQFVNESEDLHTVTAYAARFLPGGQDRIPDGTAPFSSGPVMGGESWLYQFEEEGVYDINCLPHEFLGMVMRVVVVEDDDDAPEAPDLASPEEGDPSPNAALVLSAPELEPEHIVEEGMVAWEDLTIEEKVDPSTLE